MKKIIVGLLFCVCACSFVSPHDAKFKNPIFYQPLKPLSKTATWTYLTPTSYIAMTPLDKTKIATKGQCDLIENQKNRITLKCSVEMWDKIYNKYYTYIIKELLTPTCLRILEYDYDKPEDFPRDEIFADKYCVTPLENTKSESD